MLRTCAAHDCDRGDPHAPQASPGTSHALRSSALHALEHDSHPRSRSVLDSSSGKSRTGEGNVRTARGEAATCRPSVSDRGDDKLARDANSEHRVLTAGVHRLRVSGGYPGPSFFWASSRPVILPARSPMPRLSCRLSPPATVRTRSTGSTGPVQRSTSNCARPRHVNLRAALEVLHARTRRASAAATRQRLDIGERWLSPERRTDDPRDRERRPADRSRDDPIQGSSASQDSPTSVSRRVEPSSTVDDAPAMCTLLWHRVLIGAVTASDSDWRGGAARARPAAAWRERRRPARDGGFACSRWGARPAATANGTPGVPRQSPEVLSHSLRPFTRPKAAVHGWRDRAAGT